MKNPLVNWYKKNNTFIPYHIQACMCVSVPLEEQIHVLEMVYEHTKDWQEKHGGICNILTQ